MAEIGLLVVGPRRGESETEAVDTGNPDKKENRTPLAEGKPDFWALIVVSAHIGKSSSLSADGIPEGSQAFASVRKSDSIDLAPKNRSSLEVRESGSARRICGRSRAHMTQD